MDQNELNVLKALNNELAQAKKPLIASLIKDSKGLFTQENLEAFDAGTLAFMREKFDNIVLDEYAFIVSRRRQREPEPTNSAYKTVGVWNPETKKFEGGLPDNAKET